MNVIRVFKKIFMTMLIICLVIVPFVDLPLNASTQSEWYNSGEFRDTTYTRVYSKWLNTYEVISNVNKEYSVNNELLNNESINLIVDDITQESVFSPELEESVKYIVNVSETGLYYLSLDYRFNEEFSSNPTVSFTVNGESFYNEMEDLTLNVSWLYKEREEENKYNRYDDELLPYSIPDNRWYHEYLFDAFNDSTIPNVVLLNEGDNTIEITSHQNTLLFGSLYIESLPVLSTYEEYKNSNSSYSLSNDEITLQAENYYSKNAIEIKGSYYKSYTMMPASYKSQIINMLNGGSMATSGQNVTYEINVENSGLYSINLKYKQSSLAGLKVSKNIYIDGEIPFKEFNGYSFDYTREWVNHTLGKDGTPYLIYLSEGTHYLTIESTSINVYEQIDTLYSIMDSINSIGITINTITGSSSNSAITWKITNYLPNLSNDLNNMADVIENAFNSFNRASEVSSLGVAAKTLRRLAKSPNKIQNRLTEFSEGSGSCYQLIGSAIGYLINQQMDIDFIVLGNDVELPKANGNFFGRLGFAIKSFFYSFFDKRYNIEISKDANEIDIYVSASSLYTNIIQEMCDDEFTKESGIKVNLNILSNNQALILNNATGTNPDGVLELDSWLPYTYALRGMLEDLSKYDGFDDVTKDIYSSNFTPLIYDGGVYAIPETQGMQLLFYRTDILNSLDLTVPNTWEDVLNMLPTLQSYQMNFYDPLGADSAYKGFGVTSRFFYLFDTEMYTSNGFTSNLVNEGSVQAIKYMTDLFNIYNLPQQVSSFFEHFRSGTLPIGIGGIDLYLQLKYACPELSGQWGVMPIPGFLNEDTNEVERWTTTYGKCSIMFASSKKKNQTWSFLKWWHNASTQLEYSQKIKMYLGEKYLIVPANMVALNASPWDAEIKNQVAIAAKWSRIPAITPGSYIVEREISNIWNSVVIDKVNVRVAVNESIPKINRELRRKFEEFNYLKDGTIIKDYIVPTNDNITNWVKGKDYYE